MIGSWILVFLAGCAVGPNYKRPTTATPSEYKAAELGSWKEGQPLDNLPRGNWWEIYNDPLLNEFETSAGRANQDLKAGLARLDQARGIARIAGSELMPTIDLDPSYNRQRYSPNQSPSFGPLTANTYRAQLDLSYEIDLWGRIRRGFEAARDDAQASLASYYALLLAVQADVAQNYFLLRSLDAEIASVISTVELRKEQVQLVRSRFEGGIGNELDVARAETELANAQAEAASLAKRRAELENTVAILVGASPSVFKIAALGPASPSWNPQPPGIPAGLPADLLERRPDVAEAERKLAAANARIGVAKAAFFPVVRLTQSGGYVSGEVENMFNWESRVWSIGPSVSLPIFAGGRNRAEYHRSQSAYQEAIAQYRQQILVAFGEVENSLAGVQHLTTQAEAQNRAVLNSRRAAELAAERYRSGIVSYLDVVDAGRERLQAERGQALLAGLRLVNSVQLIKALGGGWEEGRLAQNR